MRMLLKVGIPCEIGNKAVKDGSLPATVGAFVETHKPEAAYFTAENGMRTAFFVFDLKDPQNIPAIAEPFFNALGASITISPVMNLEDMRAGVAAANKK